MFPKNLLFFILLGFLNVNFAQDSSEVINEYETFDLYYAQADSLRRIGLAEDATGLLYRLLFQLEENKREEPAYFLRLSYLYQDLSYAYSYRNDSLCMLYADKAIEVTKHGKDTLQIAQSYCLKYDGMYEMDGQDEALYEVAIECVKYSDYSGHERLKMRSYMNLSDVLIELGRKNEGLIYLRKAEESLIKMDQPFSILFGHAGLGNIYYKMDDYQKGAYHHEISLKMAKEYELPDIVLRISRNLADDYYGLGNFKAAADLALVFGDSTEVYYEEQLTEEFTAGEAKYNDLKKDKEIAEKQLLISQSESKRYQVIIMGSFFLAILLIGFQWLFFRQRKRKQVLETELKKERGLNDLRTTFLENIAHEIRTPITLINGHLDLALEKNDVNIKQTEHIRLAKSNSNRILSNANEILELLKLERGELPVKKEEIHLEPFLRRVFFAFESLAELKQQKLVFESSIQANSFIESDMGRIEKMASNYVANAIKFSPPSTTVTFKAYEKPYGITIMVKDEGPGIAAKEQQQIFSRFYQSADVISIGGVGVGLSIVKEYAESLGGKVGVTSTFGNGAEFSVTLPVRIFQKGASPETEAPESNPDKHFQALNIEGKPELLIVEDNPEMNAYLKEILSTAFNCEVAFNGVDALRKVQTKKFALILSDVMMPQMDGIELKEKINALPNCKNLPFIFITAKAQLSDRILGYGLGVDDYIIKPFVKEELLARIVNLLSTKNERESWIKDNLEFLDEKGNADEKLVEKIKAVVLANLDNTEFKVSDLASEVGYSQRQLSRFLNKTIGLSPVQYILEVRLKKAHLYLSERKYATLNEVRNSVGIASASYFNRKFLERFGVKPSAV